MLLKKHFLLFSMLTTVFMGFFEEQDVQRNSIYLKLKNKYFYFLSIQCILAELKY